MNHNAPDSDMVYRTQSSQIATTNAIDAARVAIDEQRLERALALAAVAQAEALVRIEANLANIANGLAAIHLYGAGRDEQADNFAL